MLIHYLKIAFRTMWKYKAQSFTAVFGLAFGVACFVPVFYWIRYEMSYDSFYPDAKQIYRVYTMEKQSGKVNEGAPVILQKKLQEQFPAVEASTGLMTNYENCSTERMPHIRLQMLYTDSTFCHVFPQVFVSGDANQPLQVLNNIILTETTAIRLFGDVEKAIGQQVQTTMIASYPPYTVTAIVKDPPVHTNLPFDAIIFHDMIDSFAGLPEDMQWSVFVVNLYVKFHPHADVGALAEQLRDFTSRSGVNPDIGLRMLPVEDVRHKLNADVPFTLHFIGLFVASGLLLLFSAFFNFLNLYLDLFRQRSREWRQRAVHGASDGQLVWQMLFELTCAALLTMVFAGLFVVLFRPAFSGLLDMEIGLSQLLLLFVICGMGIMALMLFAGFILFRQLSWRAMLSPSERAIAGTPVLRRMAVALQLAVSVVFIVAAWVVMMQMRFTDRKDLGFDQNSVIQLSGFVDVSGKVQSVLIHELEAILQVEDITDAYFEPQHNVNPYTMITNMEWEGKQPSEKPAFHFILTDNRFAGTFGLQMLRGEWWNEGEMQKIVLNEEAARVMGLSEPVGALVRLPSSEDSSVMNEYEVAGVVNDFHTRSLRNRIQPTLFMPSSSAFNMLYIRVAPGQEWEAIRRIGAILPGIDATLADVRLTPVSKLYDRLNQSEQIGLKLFSVLATVCLLISLFGIYAIAVATTRRRRKEIAIRKVAGAEANGIVRLFFREYTLLVILAGVVALPPVYIAMSNWLQGYAYRTNIPWWLPAGVITGVVAVVLFTVSGQVLKAANSNPAEVIKSE
jgi:putative ABC transport system permease protein